MKDFVLWISGILLSIVVSVCTTAAWLKGGSAELNVKSMEVTSPSSAIAINEYGVSVRCEDGGLMQLRPGLAVEPNDPLAMYASGITSGSFTLRDASCKNGVEIGITNTLPFVRRIYGGKVIQDQRAGN